MISEYVELLENRDIVPDTNRVYSINDVPFIWKERVKTEITKDGYYIGDDGTVYPKGV